MKSMKPDGIVISCSVRLLNGGKMKTEEAIKLAYLEGYVDGASNLAEESAYIPEESFDKSNAFDYITSPQGKQ